MNTEILTPSQAEVSRIYLIGGIVLFTINRLEIKFSVHIIDPPYMACGGAKTATFAVPPEGLKPQPTDFV